MTSVRRRYFVISLGEPKGWQPISQEVQSLKGTKGLSIQYDSYIKVFLITTWKESATTEVQSIQGKVEDLGGTFREM